MSARSTIEEAVRTITVSVSTRVFDDLRGMQPPTFAPKVVRKPSTVAGG